MPIQPSVGPADGTAIVEALFAVRSMRAAKTNPARIALNPLPVFAPDLKALSFLAERALREARLVAWRYLVFKKRPAMVVDVTPAGSAYLVEGGGVARNLAGACAAAEALADGADYEPRMLDVGLIGQPVLWLMSLDSREPDRFISLRQPFRELSRPALFKKLQRRAAARLPTVLVRGGEGGG